MATRNDGKDNERGAEKEGAADQRPDELSGEDNKVLDEVQAAVDKETEQGFRGTEVDPTPNENYTVVGVTSEAPTPETDPGLAAEIAGKATTKFNNK